jgi:hypothetical protein
LIILIWHSKMIVTFFEVDGLLLNNGFAVSVKFGLFTLSLSGLRLSLFRLLSFGTLLSSPSFDDVVVDPKEEALGFAGGTKAVVKTAAGWTYEFQVGKAQEADRYPFRFTVAAELATQRVPGKDEKPEDKEKLDKEFAEKLKKQQDFGKDTKSCILRDIYENLYGTLP